VLDFTVFAPFPGDFFKKDKINTTEYRVRDKDPKPYEKDPLEGSSRR
jgi:hypothetical protein